MKPLESWEKEDLATAITDLVKALRQAVPGGRVDSGRQAAVCNARYNLEVMAQKLEERAPGGVMECCGQLDNLLDQYAYCNAPAAWESETVGIIESLTAILNGIGAELPTGHSKVVSPAEGGRLYGVAAKTFVRWVKDGRIRAKRLSTKAYQIAVEDLPKLDRR
jgi:Zn-dependent alcohol dehydrogenase